MSACLPSHYKEEEQETQHHISNVAKHIVKSTANKNKCITKKNNNSGVKHRFPCEVQSCTKITVKMGKVTNLIQPTRGPTVGRLSADALAAVFRVDNRLCWRCVCDASVGSDSLPLPLSMCGVYMYLTRYCFYSSFLSIKPCKSLITSNEACSGLYCENPDPWSFLEQTSNSSFLMLTIIQ